MENSKLKTIASHTVAIVIGIMFAVSLKSPRVEIIDAGVHEIHEVPVEVIKEVVKWKTKVIRESYEVIVDEPCTEINYIHNHVMVDREHRVSFLSGLGPKKEFVFGAGYALNITNAYSVGFSTLSNKSYLFSVGMDF